MKLDKPRDWQLRHDSQAAGLTGLTRLVLTADQSPKAVDLALEIVADMFSAPVAQLFRRRGDAVFVQSHTVTRDIEPETCVSSFKIPAALCADLAKGNSHYLPHDPDHPAPFCGALLVPVVEPECLVGLIRIEIPAAQATIGTARETFSMLGDLFALLLQRMPPENKFDASATDPHPGRSAAKTLVVADIDNLQNIRAVQGAGVVDALMSKLIERLERVPGVYGASRAQDESDALVVWLDNVPQHILDTLVQQLQEAIRQCLVVGTTSLYVTASLGVSLAPAKKAEPQPAKALLKQARIASLRAGRTGGNRRLYYSAAMEAKLARKNRVSQALHEALREHQFSLRFQPQFDIPPLAETSDGDTGHALVGAEALLRWDSPLLGQISPTEFIPIAESTGMAAEIDFHVMALFSRQIGRWRALGYDVNAALNVSSCSFEEDTLASRLLEQLANEGVDPSGVTVEITETSLLSMSPEAILNMDRFRRAGIKLSVDDFGSGYASLSYLKNLIVSEIKIDKSFIRGLSMANGLAPEGEPCTDVIARTILEMTRCLGIRALAEGVENQEQLDWLRREGCSAIQGHLVGRAVTPRVFERSHLLKR